MAEVGELQMEAGLRHFLDWETVLPRSLWEAGSPSDILTVTQSNPFQNSGLQTHAGTALCCLKPFNRSNPIFTTQIPIGLNSYCVLGMNRGVSSDGVGR